MKSRMILRVAFAVTFSVSWMADVSWPVKRAMACGQTPHWRSRVWTPRKIPSFGACLVACFREEEDVASEITCWLLPSMIETKDLLQAKR